MAQTSITLTHGKASDLRVGSGEPARLVANKFMRLLDGALAGSLAGATGFVLSAGNSTGTVTLAGSADDVTVTVGGVAVGPIAAESSDAETAEAVLLAIEEDVNASALVTGTVDGAVITLTARATGTAGNVSLLAAAVSGTATASGAALSGGTSTSYTF